MSSQYLQLYKMIVLYMLGKSDTQLSKSQIYDFILEKEYTNFLTLQEVFSELADSGLIIERNSANRTYLEMTSEGKTTLDYFENRISPSIVEEINDYFKKNGVKLRNESSIRADYFQAGENDYTVHMTAKENGITLVDISLNTPSEEAAQGVCDAWQKKNADIYAYLVSELMM